MTNPKPGPGQVTWRITSQVEQIGRVSTGQFVNGVLVNFTTNDQHSGQVFIPKEQYTAEHVREAVVAAVQTMVEVGGLTGSV